MIEAKERENMNRFPTEDHRLIFAHWKVEFYILTPLELTISNDTILLIVRTGHHIFKWEYLRRNKS
jgi:hypothetical protein